MYTEAQIAAVKGVRFRHGKFECVVHHPSLPRHGMSKVFETEREARTWKLDQQQTLAGRETESKVPEIVRHAKRPTNVRTILNEYIDTAPNVSRSLRIQATVLRNEPALDIDCSLITPLWVSKLVESYKTGPDRITPQSIRKKMVCLRLVIQWYHHHYWVLAGLPAPVNHLSQMPHKYDKYDESDPDARLNRRRKRRLLAGEEQAIEDVITGVKRRKCNRPVRNPVETMMLFRLLTSSGLRLREAYTLRAADIDMTKALITVGRSKLSYKGEAAGARTVPIMHAQLYRWVKEYMEAKGITPGSQDPLFACWWKGETDKDELQIITTTISHMFSALFVDAGCENLIAHDLRHESVSRWCELKGKDGRKRYSMGDVMKFTGHKSAVTFDSYLHFFMDDHVPEDVQALLD